MTNKGLYYDVENPSSSENGNTDYPMAEAVPIMDSPVEAYTDDEESGRPPSINPNYHAMDNGDQDQNVPTISATPANTNITTATAPTATTAVNSIHTTTVTTLPPFLGRHPTTVVCPYCHVEMRTRTFQHANIFTWVAAVLLGLVCCCLCLVPFCCRSCKETEHYCTHCHRLVSKVGPLSFSSK